MNQNRFIPQQNPANSQMAIEPPRRPERRRTPLAIWYSWSAPDEKPGTLPQDVNRGRLSSILLLITLIGAIAFIPAALTSDNLHVLPPLIVLFLVVGISIPLNRQGYVTVVGILIVCTIDLALIFALLTYANFVLPQNAVPIYDLFVLSDIIAISLLPPRSIIYISIFHSLFMCADIALQPHTPDLAFLVNSTNYSIMVRPLTIQIVVALVTYLWVRNTNIALERANKAEVIAQLERQLALQKKDLDEGIQELLFTLVQAANGDLRVRAPLAHENVLWQVDVALNTLLARLQRTNQSEFELQKLKNDLRFLAHVVRETKNKRTIFWLSPNGTLLDPLVNELGGCHLIQQPTNSQRFE